eukprot:CAMPEP_0174251374 /NCGR_PEP_ID=MMETSP0439-20130205/1216_1 /TAXON_ID=0 /ORGANISM="Stereomyxa ramosa, Strain Chinc5" /LENGTH=807 /DNA_ID=CAMNT_0015331667 /DNA_START=17 /DNA_END=2440 /DNA_ORIENTATION=-
MNDEFGNSSPMDLEAKYTLSQELAGHEADVRSICSPSKDCIVTCSRDQTVRVWRYRSGVWEQDRVLNGHENFVSVVIPVPGGFASGGNDKVINIWEEGDSSEPLQTLIGHEGAVVALDTTLDGGIVSGSWDHTAKIWKDGQCVATLKGHTQAVWAVLCTPTGDILTASADKTIKLWRNGTCIQTFRGHTDCVRGLAIVEGVGFMSVANDSVVKIWAFSGEECATLVGHSAYVYSVTTIPTGFATCGEDRALKIWEGNVCVQTIYHPSSVWCVCSLSNGDIATACADGIARVWTKDPNRKASAELQDLYNDLVSSTAIPRELAVGDLNTEKLPGEEALTVAGKEGETKMIKRGNKVEAHQWDGAAEKWVKLGEVVDAVGNSSKAVIAGEEYDYVFDVDLGDGGPTKKLGYNTTENPYMAAQRFLWREGLNQGFLDQVAEFIAENVKGITLGATEPQQSVDPFTGRSRYVPGTSHVGQLGNDPFTGGSRYVPGTGSSGNPRGADPFTGSGRYIPSPEPGNVPPSNNTTTQTSSVDTSIKSPYKHFPNKVVLDFKSTKWEALEKKLHSYNEEVKKDEEFKQQHLLQSEFRTLKSIIDMVKESSRYRFTSFPLNSLKIFTKLLSWPPKKRFPGLDLIHRSLLLSEAADLLSTVNLLELVLPCLEPSNPLANILLGMRLLANMFHFQSTRIQMLSQAEKVLEALADHTGNSNKNVRLALVTVIVNYAVSFLAASDAQSKTQCVSIINEVLSTETDAEVLYRALVALGTLIWQDEDTKQLLGAFELLATVTNYTENESGKVKEVASEIIQYAQ